MTKRLPFLLTLYAVLACALAPAQEGTPTYAEKLGWEPGARVVIFHSDDAGMSHESNAGTIKALEEGVLTSMSTMMPCSWVSEFAKYLREHPETDNGLHLTFTSEWGNYRWGPLASKYLVPGLVDKDGCFWGSVKEVADHATAKELETELRAQIDRAETMGIPITHLDTHMGTVFETEEFFSVYMRVGIEKQIPVMVPAGHMTLTINEYPDMKDRIDDIRQAGALIWSTGLPVVDDIFGDAYGWKSFEDKKANMIKLLRELKPGVTQVIIHCNQPSEVFQFISSSGKTRESDMLVMLDPDVKKTIEEEGIILTTWRELKERRDKVGK
jgi:predicted glycoside hydrolase/deacetylase ChbG (UPF0249 family)